MPSCKVPCLGGAGGWWWAGSWMRADRWVDSRAAQRWRASEVRDATCVVIVGWMGRGGRGGKGKGRKA
jgi:hypothetical protein